MMDPSFPIITRSIMRKNGSHHYPFVPYPTCRCQMSGITGPLLYCWALYNLVFSNLASGDLALIEFQILGWTYDIHYFEALRVGSVRPGAWTLVWPSSFSTCSVIWWILETWKYSKKRDTRKKRISNSILEKVGRLHCLCRTESCGEKQNSKDYS